MSNNVFISFEFNRPDRTYDRVVHVIKSMSDSWAEIHFAHWYVSTTQSAKQVCERLKPLLDGSDKLIVVDTTNNKAAWANLGEDAIKRLQEQGY